MSRGISGTGVRTLDDLRGRCEVVGACWLWLGGMANGLPTVRCPDAEGVSRPMAGRRAGMILAGRKVAGRIVMARACCAEDLCVAPDHSAAFTPAERGKRLADAGTMRGKRHGGPLRGSALAHAKLDAVKAQAIRARPGAMAADLATEYGVSRSTINRVRRGQVYRAAALSSVWTWMPPAAGNDARRSAA